MQTAGCHGAWQLTLPGLVRSAAVPCGTRVECVREHDNDRALDLRAFRSTLVQHMEHKLIPIFVRVRVVLARQLIKFLEMADQNTRQRAFQREE